MHFIGGENVIELFLENKADINIQTNEGNTVLIEVIENIEKHSGIIHEFEYIIELLLQNSSIDSINMQNKKGDTALHTLIRRHYFKDIYNISNLLIQYGIDKNIKNKENKTASDIFFDLIEKNKKGREYAKTMKLKYNFNFKNDKCNIDKQAGIESKNEIKFNKKLFDLLKN